MKKYYAGILIIAFFSFGSLLFTISQASAQKEDKTTHKKAQEIAKKLNSYITSNRRLPENFEEADIKDVPNTISYAKVSGSEYKFCETYNSESSYSGPGITSLLYGASLRSFEDKYDSDDDSSAYTPSSLYISYSHKKGENCQNVKPYYLNSARSSFETSLTPRNNTPTASGSALSRNIERQTDIKTLHAQLEAYYAQNGYYPTLVNMNSSSFRSSNMKGLDSEALADPVGKNPLLVSSPKSNGYSYAVRSATGVTCNNTSLDCTEYTLTATLEGGGTYVKESLN